MAAPIHILHNSPGELAGRESWMQNRIAFINNHKFPITCLGAKPLFGS